MDWKNRLEQIRNKLKLQFHAKGVDNLHQLQKVFDEYDIDRSGTLDKLEFEEMTSKLGCFMTTQELTCVYNHFDKNKDGHIAYEEFINAIRSDMNEKRLAVVKHAWQSLDENREGKIAWGKLQTAYKADEHPRSKTREKKSEAVRAEFIDCMGRHQKNGIVTEQGFIEYYADVNATLPAEKDDYFVDTVLKTWGLTASKVFVAPARIDEIESIVFEKIRQRTHGSDDEGKTVKKIFKHFDLNGFGTIEPAGFKKALETLGCVFQDIELEHFFRRFDTNGNGKLDYEEFAAAFARRGSGNSPNVNPVFGITREPPNTVLDKILVVLKQRGTYGIRGLGRVFRRMDNSGNGRLDRQEFTWGLKENGHVLSPSEFERLFKYFDKNNDGVLDYNEFLVGLRGNLNARRRAIVQRAFKKFDKTGNGVVDLEDLAGVYDVSKHPRLRSGAKTKDELLNEWLSQWDTIKADGKVSLAEFEEFYKDVSASIDDDEYFEFVITSAWKL